MRRLLAFLMLATTGFAAPNYKLVWSDEFDYTGLPNPAKWYYDVGGWGWGNNELEFYKAANPRNTWVDSGVLRITVRREDTTYADWNGNPKTNHLSSARINTYDRQLWTYGRFEARMKLPKGAGQWPAFWVVPPAGSPYGQWPASGEIDILENYGIEPWVMHGSAHTANNYGATSKNGYAVVDHPNDSFHVYALDWKPDTIAISVDGQEYFRYVNPHTTFADWPFDQKSFIILNVAVNGSWGAATVDTTVLPQSLVVDYVRVYQDPLVSGDSTSLTLEQTQGGTVSVSPVKPSYRRGEKVLIRAVADSGYAFVGWATGTTTKLATDSVLVESLSTLSARFVATGERIANGGFDLGWDGWSFWTHSSLASTYALRDGGACVHPGGVGDFVWYTQMRYAGFGVQTGSDYQLTFLARASSKRTFNLLLSQANTPWDSLSSRPMVAVDTSWTRESVRLLATASAPEARLELNFANDTAEICLDSVSLKLSPSASVVSAPVKRRPRASVSGGTLEIASDIAGSWSLRRQDGRFVGQGACPAGGTRKLGVGAKGLLVLRFKAVDGTVFQTTLTSL